MVNLFIAIGLAGGILFGLLAGATGSEFLMAVATGSEPLGILFVRGIKMVVIPLVGTTVFVGVARLGDVRKLGRLGGLAFAYFWATQLIAIAIGMAVMSLGLRLAPRVPVPPVTAQGPVELPGMVDFLLSLVPENPFATLAEGALLPLIVFTILFAAACGALEDRPRELLIEIAQAVSDTLIRLVHWILWVAPIGVFGLAAPMAAQTGWGMIASLAVFIGSVAVALAVLAMVVHFPALLLLGRMSPPRFVSQTLGSMAIAFATTSTPAALPAMLEEAEEDLGLDPDVATLVLSLGVSMYRAGSALFQGACVVFLAHIFEVPLPLSAVAGGILATFLVSLTVAPVPSAAVMTLAPALDTTGVPLDGLGILLGVDRVPDMMRTTLNALGQMTAAVVVDQQVRTEPRVRGGAGPGPGPGEGARQPGG